MTLAAASLLALAPLAAAGSPQAQQSPDPARFAGHWEGAIDLPDVALGVRVDLVAEAERWSGTIDIPMQRAHGLALADVLVEGERVSFAIAGVPGAPRFEGRLEDGAVRGTFRQGAIDAPFRLGREPLAPPARPQEPRPPFPYRCEEVTYPSGEVVLAGTLTLPPGEGPFPAAVLISGSGAQDRDETLLGHRPFLVLADHLTRAGIAVLRSDDRGVGGSGGSIEQATSADFARDARAALELCAARPEIDARRIGLIGHSEGGMIAPLAAAEDERVAFLVLLAGPGTTIRELLARQVERLALAEGVASDVATELARLQREALDVLGGDLSEEERRALLRGVVLRQAALQGDTDAEAIDAALEAGIQEAATPWFRFFVGYDPRVALERVRVPVLALNGTLDTQVDAAQNLSAIVAALARGGNADATVVALPGLNHLFQHATTGSPSEYATIEETMAPEALERISAWIEARFGGS